LKYEISSLNLGREDMIRIFGFASLKLDAIDYDRNKDDVYGREMSLIRRSVFYSTDREAGFMEMWMY